MLSVQNPIQNWDRRANSGGPMSRTRREVINTTLLGHDDHAIRCPRIVALSQPIYLPGEQRERKNDEQGHAAGEQAGSAQCSFHSGIIARRSGT